MRGRGVGYCLFYNSRILRSALTLLTLLESSGGLFTKGSGPTSPLTKDKAKASVYLNDSCNSDPGSASVTIRSGPGLGDTPKPQRSS